MSACTLLLLLVSCSGALASHFYGGTLTFTPKGRNPDGSFRVDIRYKQTYESCSLWNEWYCLSGDCGSDSRFEVAEVDSGTSGVSYYGGRWCTSEALMTKNIRSNQPFEMWKTGCCWIYNSESTYQPWSLLTHVDLGIRSDTREPNRSPVTAVLPFIRVPQNCPRRFDLLAHDPDNDQVICRYGRGNECSYCSQHPGFHLDQNSCTLTYQYNSIQNAHAFEIVLEDFPRQQITLSYTDGTLSIKSPLVVRDKRWYYGPMPTLPPTTSSEPTTTEALTTTSEPTTTEALTTTSEPTTTEAPTTTNPPTTTMAPTTTSAPTTTEAPTTTNPPTTTMAPTTTSAPTTTEAPTTTSPPTTTMAPTTTSNALQLHQHLRLQGPLQLHQHLRLQKPLQLHHHLRLQKPLQLHHPLQLQTPLQLHHPLRLQTPLQLYHPLRLQWPLQLCPCQCPCQ
ncbi:uncharacterized protein LOC135242227 [Anguilla rostrata]|uniref:uncharacterized protein LOC135242227 n=1 Tax=Anguilla rostrata TaxID=7938 RepID=UPI0030CD8B4C